LSWRGSKRVDSTKGRDGMAAEQVLQDGHPKWKRSSECAAQ
jgi:hypothetical protein